MRDGVYTRTECKMFFLFFLLSYMYIAQPPHVNATPHAFWDIEKLFNPRPPTSRLTNEEGFYRIKFALFKFYTIKSRKYTYSC